MMMDMIFEGTLYPNQMRIVNSEEYTRACRRSKELLKKLMAQLPSEDYALVEDLTKDLLDAGEIECKHHFQYGMVCGMILMHEAQEIVEK